MELQKVKKGKDLKKTKWGKMTTDEEENEEERKL